MNKKHMFGELHASQRDVAFHLHLISNMKHSLILMLLIGATLEFNLRGEPPEDSMRLGIFSSSSRRTFKVNETPQQAQNVINNMRASDAMPNGSPPGVNVTGSGGSYAASSPAARARADVTAQGNQVSEYAQFQSNIPFASAIAALVHRAATDPEEAYNRAKDRCKGPMNKLND